MDRSLVRWLLGCAGALAIAPMALAWVTIGHGRVVGSAAANLDYDSNVFLNSRQQEDWVGRLRGDMRYVRDSSIVTLDAAAGFSAVRYAEFHDQDAIDPFVSAKVAYRPSDKIDLTGNVSMHRTTISNDAVNDRTKSNDFVTDGSAEHLFSEKLGWRATGHYSILNYLTPGYSDVGNYGLGLHAVHAYSPKLKLLTGLTGSESWTSAGATNRSKVSSQSWRYTVGAEGEFAPKITGNIHAGVEQQGFRSAGFGGSTTLYLSSKLVWAASEKSNWTLGAIRDMGVSAADQASKTSDLSLSVNRSLNAKLVLEGGVSYGRASYDGFRGTGSRKDRSYTARTGCRYTLKSNTTIEVSAGYRDNRSSLAVASYKRVTGSAGIVLQF